MALRGSRQILWGDYVVQGYARPFNLPTEFLDRAWDESRDRGEDGSGKVIDPVGIVQVE